jgi:hypothetical protein
MTRTNATVGQEVKKEANAKTVVASFIVRKTNDFTFNGFKIRVALKYALL